MASSGVSSTNIFLIKLGRDGCSEIFSFQSGLIFYIYSLEGLPLAARIKANYCILLDPWNRVKQPYVKALNGAAGFVDPSIFSLI